MITYEANLFGLKNLSRVHGSAAYKVVFPALLSTIIIILFHRFNLGGDQYFESENRIVQHPFTVGAFIGFFSFLLTFRLNYAYQRYWEGASAIHQMQSKWLDVAMNLASYHYQSDRFDDITPPTLGKLENVTTSDIVGRARNFECSYDDMVDQVDAELKQRRSLRKQPWWKRRVGRPHTESRARRQRDFETDRRHGKMIDSHKPDPNNSDSVREMSVIPIPQRFQEDLGVRMTLSDESDPDTSELRNYLIKQPIPSLDLARRESRVPSPSLFLQEVAHLLSLLSGVALSTLRNDMEEAESPLTTYYPGKPWPPVDPDDLDDETRNRYGEEHTLARWIYFCLGLDRSTKHRTLYNAARPFGVLGGVSDEEISRIQKARGPAAKVYLCTMWLQEFITREYMAGSTGRTAPPILSRLYQFISDGTVGYNNARKVAYIPYPFVNAQITIFFLVAIALIFPLLLYSYVNHLLFGCFLNFIIVMW